MTGGLESYSQEKRCTVQRMEERNKHYIGFLTKREI